MVSLPIIIDAQPTLREFLRLNFHVALPRRVRWIFGLVLGLIAVHPLCALYLNWPMDNYLRAHSGLLLLPGCLAGYVFLIYVAARRRWNSASEVREPKRYEFSDFGIRIQGESSNGSMAWRNIKTAETCSDLIVLRTFQRAFLWIPAPAFKDQKALAAFKELVRNNVVDCKL